MLTVKYGKTSWIHYCTGQQNLILKFCNQNRIVEILVIFIFSFLTAFLSRLSAVLRKADTSHTWSVMRKKMQWVANKKNSSSLSEVVFPDLGGVEIIRMTGKIQQFSNSDCLSICGTKLRFLNNKVLGTESYPQFVFLPFLPLPASLMSEATLFF